MLPEMVKKVDPVNGQNMYTFIAASYEDLSKHEVLIEAGDGAIGYAVRENKWYIFALGGWRDL